ncbi:hypothetical protein DFH27DRAFT_348795 [Peziza echinospora]|nr:hypothetical protein DFH27DRAFT_348795 [Peziza echinospora]
MCSLICNSVNLLALHCSLVYRCADCASSPPSNRRALQLSVYSSMGIQPFMQLTAGGFGTLVYHCMLDPRQPNLQSTPSYHDHTHLHTLSPTAPAGSGIRAGHAHLGRPTHHRRWLPHRSQLAPARRV